MAFTTFAVPWPRRSILPLCGSGCHRRLYNLSSGYLFSTRPSYTWDVHDLIKTPLARLADFSSPPSPERRPWSAATFPSGRTITKRRSSPFLSSFPPLQVPSLPRRASHAPLRHRLDLTLPANLLVKVVSFFCSSRTRMLLLLVSPNRAPRIGGLPSRLGSSFGLFLVLRPSLLFFDTSYLFSPSFCRRGCLKGTRPQENTRGGYGLCGYRLSS